MSRRLGGSCVLRAGARCIGAVGMVGVGRRIEKRALNIRFARKAFWKATIQGLREGA